MMRLKMFSAKWVNSELHFPRVLSYCIIENIHGRVVTGGGGGGGGGGGTDYGDCSYRARTTPLG